MVTITVYRGTKEIGGSAVELSTETARILFDIGTPLSEDKTKLPDIKGLYAWDTPGFDAVVISHAHLDHYGFAHFVHPDIPIYLSKGTKALIELTQRFITGAEIKSPMHVFSMYESFEVGGVRIIPYLMDHSAFDAAAFEIFAEDKRIVYSGDFRCHGRKEKCFYKFIRTVKKSPDMLICEGTSFGRADADIKTEDDLELDIAVLAGSVNGAVLFQCSGQNIDRLVSVYKAAIRSKRQLVVDVYIANVLADLRGLGGNKLPYPSDEYKNIRVFYPYPLTRKIFDEIGSEYAYRFTKFKISKPEIEARQNELIMMIRPSQLGDLKTMSGLRNGLFIHSMWEGYKTESRYMELEAYLKAQNFKCVQRHVGGHADTETIKALLSALEPKSILPIHTLYPERFSDFSDKIITARDGEALICQ